MWPIYSCGPSPRPLGFGVWNIAQDITNFWSRDLTHSAQWVATNVTPTLNQTGIDGSANAASKICATQNNATIFQTNSTSTFFKTFSAFVKAITVTGEIDMTADGGTTKFNIAPSINSTSYTRVPIGLDPVGAGIVESLGSSTIGFVFATSGDCIAVDYANIEVNQFGSGTFNGPTPPVLTVAGSGSRSPDLAVVPLSKIIGFNSDSFTIISQFIIPNWQTPTSSCTASATECPANSGIWSVDDGTTNNAVWGMTQAGQFFVGCSPTCDNDFNVQVKSGGSGTQKVRATSDGTQITGLVHPVAGAVATLGICYDRLLGIAISVANGAGVGPTTEAVQSGAGGLASGVLNRLVIGSAPNTNALAGYLRWMKIYNGCSPGAGKLTRLVTQFQNAN